MKTKEEIWKPIPEWERYCVSDAGNVKSVARIRLSKAGKEIHFKGKILTKSLSKGYPVVCLHKQSGKHRVFAVHQLIALAFIDKDYIKNEFVCNHKDGIKTNSFLSNLEIVTYSQNMTHAYTLRLNKNLGMDHVWTRHSDEVIEDVRLMISQNCSALEISKKHGINAKYIRQIRRNKKRNLPLFSRPTFYTQEQMDYYLKVESERVNAELKELKSRLLSISVNELPEKDREYAELESDLKIKTDAYNHLLNTNSDNYNKICQCQQKLAAAKQALETEYQKGYNDAQNEAVEEIRKNYHPNN